MAKLFVKIPEEKRKSKIILIRLNAEDAQKIRHAADIRSLSTSEFLRRAALGRRADVRIETQIILEISQIINILRKLHAAFLERGIEPPVELLSPLMDEAMDAMRRITK